MQTLTIDPVVPFLIPESPRIAIALVGCGGTGSHIAQAMARLAVHCRDTGGPQIDLAFIDGDTVERTNVGRQLFSAADIGRNKAQALAARFAAVFGLPIAAFPQMLDTSWSSHLAAHQRYGVLVGAVDTAAGRRAIAATLGGAWRLWLDCGNHEHSGQVVVGSRRAAGGMAGCLSLSGVCGALPTAPLLYPELLKDAPARPRADCATAMQDNAQSLIVNQMMAAIAGQYLYQIVVARRLTIFRTVVDLGSLTMRSDPITAANLSAATGLTLAALRGEQAKQQKGKRAA
ncbi:MAG: PRTRC system ThiF family protein [Acidobacteria bacterium]|nr:PRTRC system ThiF family protein [Acidobacteriota bacterium]